MGQVATVSTGPDPGVSHRRDWLLVMAAATVTAGLALYHLGTPSLWADEGHSAYGVTGTWSQYGRTLTFEPNFALYHSLLRLWTRLGSSEVVLRLPSVAFATATVPTVFAVARRLFGRRAAAIATVLVAVNVLVVGYGRECRPYAMVGFTATLSSLLFLRALERPGSRRWTVWALGGALVALSHPIGLTVLVAQLLALLLRWRTVPWGELLHGAQESLVLVILLTLLLIRVGPARLSWIPPPSRAQFVEVMEDVAGRHGPLPLVADVIAAGGAVVAAIRTGRKRGPLRWATAFTLCWLAVPIGATVLVSVAQPFLISRYLIVVVPPLAILVGAGAAQLRPRWAAVAGLGLVALAAPTHVGVPVSPRDDWRWAVATVQARAEPGDIVVVTPFGQQAFRYYVRVRAAGTPAIPVLAAGRFVGAVTSGDAGCVGRVWVALRAIPDSPAVTDVLGDVHVVDTFHRGLLRVVLYEPDFGSPGVGGPPGSCP